MRDPVLRKSVLAAGASKASSAASLPAGPSADAVVAARPLRSLAQRLHAKSESKENSLIASQTSDASLASASTSAANDESPVPTAAFPGVHLSEQDSADMEHQLVLTETDDVKIKPILSSELSRTNKKHRKSISFDERESVVVTNDEPPILQDLEDWDPQGIEAGTSAAEYVPQVKRLAPPAAAAGKAASGVASPRFGSGRDRSPYATSPTIESAQPPEVPDEISLEQPEMAACDPVNDETEHFEENLDDITSNDAENGELEASQDLEDPAVFASDGDIQISQDQLVVSATPKETNKARMGANNFSSSEAFAPDATPAAAGETFRKKLRENHERLHQELRTEHLKVEHSLESAQRAVLFTAREAFLNQALSSEVQATKETQMRELAWLAEKQRQQVEERSARASIKSMQAEQVKLIKSLQNRIKDLEEVVNLAKSSRIHSRRKREQFNKKISFIEEQQQKERQLLLDSQLRSSQVDRKLYEIEIRHLPDWKRRVLLEERKLVEQQKNILLHRQAEHLREYQLLQLRHMQKTFDMELSDQDRKEEILSEQRAELQSMRARQFKEFRAEKERLAAQRSQVKSKIQAEQMEQQIQLFRVQQARQIRHSEAGNRRQTRARQKQFDEEERHRDAEFREFLASGMHQSQSSSQRGASERGGKGVPGSDDDGISDSIDARSDDQSIGSSNMSDVLQFDAMLNENEADKNAQLNANTKKLDEYGNPTVSPLQSQQQQQKSDLTELAKKDKLALAALTARHDRELEDLVNVHREQLELFQDDHKKRLSALKHIQEDEIKSMKFEQLEEVKELEKIQKEEQLNAKTANDQIDAVLTGMMDAMVVADQTGTIQIFNAASQRLFGYSEDEVIGQNVRVLMETQFAEGHQHYIDRYIDTGVTSIINTPGREVEGRHKSGLMIPIWLSVSDRDLQGKRIFVACIHDIRSQKEKEQEIHAKTEKVHSIIESMMEPLIVADQTGAITEFNSATCEMFGYTAEELRNQNVRILTGPELSKKHDSFLSKYLKTRKGSVIGTSGREVVGFRKDGTTLPIRLSLSARDIVGGTMFVAVLSDIRAMKAREASIKAQTESFQIVLDALYEPVIVCSTNGIVKQTNASTEKLLGYTITDLIGQNISILEGSDAPAWTERDFLDLMDRVEEKGNQGVLVHRRSKSGEDIVMSMLLAQRMINGEQLFIVTLTDVRDLVAREQEVLTKSQQLSAILDSMLEPLVVSDHAGKILTVNSATSTMFGYTREELLNSNVAVLTGPSLERIHHTFIENYLRTGVGRVVGTTGRNVTGYRKDRTEVPIRLSLSDRNVNGNRMFVAVLSDISAQIQREKQIAEQVESVRSVLDSMLEPVVCATSTGVVTLVNKAVTTQLLYSERELVGRNVSVLTGPTIAPIHDSFIERYISTGKGKVIGTSGREIIAYRKDGTSFPARLSLSDRVLNGERTFIAVLAQSQRTPSQQLVAAESEMLSTVLDLIPDSVTITDSQGHMRKVNDSMLELFGYDQGELEGKPASSLFQGLSEGTTFMQDFLNGGPEPKSAKGVRKDGVIIDVIMAATKKKSETSCSYILFINAAE